MCQLLVGNTVKKHVIASSAAASRINGTSKAHIIALGLQTLGVLCNPNSVIHIKSKPKDMLSQPQTAG